MKFKFLASSISTPQGVTKAYFIYTPDIESILNMNISDRDSRLDTLLNDDANKNSYVNIGETDIVNPSGSPKYTINNLIKTLDDGSLDSNINYSEWNTLILFKGSLKYLVLYTNRVYDTSSISSMSIRLNFTNSIGDESTFLASANISLYNDHINEYYKDVASEDDQVVHNLVNSILSRSNTNDTYIVNATDDISMDDYVANSSIIPSKSISIVAGISNDSRCFLSASQSVMYLIELKSDNHIYVYNYFNVDDRSLTINEDSMIMNNYLYKTKDPISGSLRADIDDMMVLEDGAGLIARSKGTYYIWTLKENLYTDLKWIGKLSDYDLLIPSFMDISNCYIKILKPYKYATTNYQIKYWRELAYESDESDFKMPSNYNYKYENEESTISHDSIVDFLSLNNNSGYFSGENTSTDLMSPVAIFSDMCNDTSKLDIDGSPIDLNMRLMALSYLDLMSDGLKKYRYIVPHDCGLEVITDIDDDDKYFIDYTSEDLSGIYKIPKDAYISNKCYLLNGSIYNMNNTQLSYSNVITSKYGILIERGR